MTGQGPGVPISSSLRVPTSVANETYRYVSEQSVMTDGENEGDKARVDSTLPVIGGRPQQSKPCTHNVSLCSLQLARVHVFAQQRASLHSTW